MVFGLAKTVLPSIKRLLTGGMQSIGKSSINVHGRVEQLRAQLEALNMDKRGNKETLKKRLTTYKREENAPSKSHPEREWMKEYRKQRKSVPLEYLLVIDFEANCWDDNRHKLQEIIEFPIVLVDLKARKIVATFTRHVKPVEYPKLTDFCTHLTGITQAQANAAKTFPSVLEEVEAWLKAHCRQFRPPIIQESAEDRAVDEEASAEEEKHMGRIRAPRYTVRNWSLATDGRTDIETFLKDQMKASGVQIPEWTLGPYVDTRTIFSMFSKAGRMPLAEQLAYLGLKFEGREHCGMDDSINIARVVLELVKRGAAVHNNRYLDRHDSGRIKSNGTVFVSNTKLTLTDQSSSAPPSGQE